MPISNHTTIASPVTLSGIGLHTGREVTLTVSPANAGDGIYFIYGGVRIPATVDSVAATVRNTELSACGITINTVEHVIAALRGTGICNATVEMSGPEPPAADGSALPFADAFASAGVTTLGAPLEKRTVTQPFTVARGSASVTCLPASSLHITFILEYDHPMIGRQQYHYAHSPGAFVADIAPARTFGLIEEVEQLRAAGLALGGNEDNAIIVFPDRFSVPLRFADEFVRHKILDMIGDLALAGCCDICAHFVAEKSGHALNAELVREFINNSIVAE